MRAKTRHVEVIVGAAIALTIVGSSTALAAWRKKQVCWKDTPVAPAHFDGTITYDCHAGQRGQLLGRVELFSDAQSNESNRWYLSFRTSQWDFFDRCVRASEMLIGTPEESIKEECTSYVRYYHPDVDGGLPREGSFLYGDPIEGGCTDNLCGWRLQVLQTACFCLFDAHVPT